MRSLFENFHGRLRIIVSAILLLLVGQIGWAARPIYPGGPTTFNSGLPTISMGLTSLQNLNQAANRDLNSRLFRARSGANRQGPNIVSTLDAGDSRFLGFGEGSEVPVSLRFDAADTTASTITVPIGGMAKSPLDGKIVISDEAPSRFEVFTEFDYGYYDQDDLSAAARGFDSDTYGTTLGAEYRISERLNVGVSITHQMSDAELDGGLGSSDIDGQIYSLYFTSFRGSSFVDFLYSYGDFDNETTRNTLLGAFARGDTNSHGHNLSLNTGTLLHSTESFSYGPILSFDYVTGSIDGYTETGGGIGNLVVPEQDFDSAITRLGGVANFYYDTKLGSVTSQLRASWAHEYSPDAGIVTAGLQAGGLTLNRNRGRVGTDWVELGATTRLEFENLPIHLELSYQGMLGWDRAVAHFGSLRLGYSW